MEEKKNKKTLRLMLLFLLILLISIGYATLTKRLDVKGTASIVSQTWDVKFQDIDTTSSGNGPSSDTVSATTPVLVSTNTTNDTLRFSVTMKRPGDSYKFTTKICNDGSVPAYVKLTKTQLGSVAEEWMNYTITGLDSNGEGTLQAGTSSNPSCKTLTVKIEYEPSKTTLPSQAIITNYLTNVAIEAMIEVRQAD